MIINKNTRKEIKERAERFAHAHFNNACPKDITIVESAMLFGAQTMLQMQPRHEKYMVTMTSVEFGTEEFPRSTMSEVRTTMSRLKRKAKELNDGISRDFDYYKI